CNCDIQGSEYDQCDDSGQCRCRPGFEGLRCDRPNCPTCFSPIQKKVAPVSDMLFYGVCGMIEYSLLSASSYDQTSADVKSLEKRAGALSDEAKQESKMADSMLKDISRLEKNLPPSMKGDVDAMVTRLDGLKEAVQRNISAVEDLLDAVEEDRTIAEDLLDKGKIAQQQISDSKALADGAIKRLPSINSTIQEAVRINGETQSALDKASKDYNNAMGTISILDNLADSLEYVLLVHMMFVMSSACRASSHCAHISQSGSFRDVFLSSDNSTPVDEEQLRKLEETLAKAEKDVEGRLRPRLQDMEEQEEAHRRRLTAINLDIDSVLADIANLEDILRTIPSGCFTNPPIEEA
ncbi:hypothetical protein XENOCAPTIV_008855, partial [Xenoophorus captivus]